MVKCSATQVDSSSCSYTLSSSKSYFLPIIPWQFAQFLLKTWKPTLYKRGQDFPWGTLEKGYLF